MLVLLAVCQAPEASLAAGVPALSEQDAGLIASGNRKVEEALSRHPELELRARFMRDECVWEVGWSNPANGRRLITVTVDDASGSVIDSEVKSEVWLKQLPLRAEDEVIAIAEGVEEVRDELEGREDVSRGSDFDDGVWTVNFHAGGSEIARVLVDDESGEVSEIMVGPQVAWQMARGYEGAFGRVINNPWLWLSLCLVFLAPFIDVRNPLKLLHLDLLVLLSFSASHYFFNEGRIFTSVPLALPPLIYMFGRLAWLGIRRPPVKPPRLHLNFSSRLLLLGLVALLTFRLGINIIDSNVVDVGYSGVIGADLIQQGKSPYGNFPGDNGNGDTYGPLNYLVYVPFERALPWSGGWDDLPAAHGAAIFFDLLAVAGLYVAGRKLGGSHGQGNNLGLALAFAWAAYPYTAFVLNCNVNDTIVAAFLIWGFVFLRAAPLAGLLLGAAAAVKFFPVILAPLWASYPDSLRGWGRRLLFVGGFAAALLLVLPVIFMGDGSLTTFWERSLEWQLDRESPFSVWGQYREHLGPVQRWGQYALAAAALLVCFLPRRKTAARMAALSAALIVGFQLLQTHWFYLYIPWFFPLALIAVLLPGRDWPARRKERALDPAA